MINPGSGILGALDRKTAHPGKSANLDYEALIHDMERSGCFYELEVVFGRVLIVSALLFGV